MNSVFFCIVVVLVAALVFAVREDGEGFTTSAPGFRVRLTQAGLDQARDLAVDLMMEELGSLRIPDVSDSIAVGDVTISNIRVTSFPRPEAHISPVEGYGVRWTASNMNPVLEANYKLQIKKWVISITKRGTVTARGRAMYFTLDFQIGRDENGKPTAYGVTCNSGGSISLSFSGQWSDGLNAGSSVFRGQITNLVRSQLCAAARKEIEQKMNAEFSSFPVTQRMEGQFVLDYSLTQFPDFQSDYLESYHKGGIYLESNPEEPPFEPAQIPPYPEHTEHMVYFYVTDYIINSGLYAAFRDGQLNAVVTKDADWMSSSTGDFLEVPSEASAHAPYLRTYCPEDVCLGTIFPGVAEQFPDGMAEIDVFATSSPRVYITGGNTLRLTGRGQMDVLVRHTPQSGNTSLLQPAFSVNMTVEADVRINVNSSRLTFHVLHAEPKADVIESLVGDIGNGFFFEALFRLAVQMKLLPKLNALGAAGIALPSLKDVHLENTRLVQVHHQNLIVIATDVAANQQ